MTSGRVRAEGDLDFRGTLGVDRDAPVGFAAIRLSFEPDTDERPGSQGRSRRPRGLVLEGRAASEEQPE